MKRTSHGLEITHDELWPREPEYRYRLVARIDDSLDVLAVCPEPGGIGQAMIQIHEDLKEVGMRLPDLGQIGVLDVCPGGEPSPRGDWVVLPFNRGGGV